MIPGGSESQPRPQPALFINQRGACGAVLIAEEADPVGGESVGEDVGHFAIDLERPDFGIGGVEDDVL